MSRENACCFSGHRYLDSDYSRSKLIGAVEALIEKGIDTFIAGGALGFDTEVALCILGLKKSHPQIKLHIYVPCQGQESRWSFSERRQYKEILKKADFVDIPSYTYTKDCMKIRNYKMVDSAAYLITYYDGTYISGTGQTFRYARRSGLEIINLCPHFVEKRYGED